MGRTIKHISHISDDFDFYICGVNGVLNSGGSFNQEAVETLYKLYQSGKQVMLASNFAVRVETLFYELKKCGIPMYIFNSIITAGEIVHFYLKSKPQVGKMYYPVVGTESQIMKGLDYGKTESPVLADFLLAETSLSEIDLNEKIPLLEQALELNLPMICVGNNTSVMINNKVCAGVGCLAEKYALMGGKIIPFGKPDIKIASYLTEGLKNFSPEKCLIIGDNMATDMRMGYNLKAKTMLIGSGIHQLSENDKYKTNELISGYGFDVDYFAENLQW
ncbi:MAG: HAD hydrolase-like protein [Alphaproteobacteria bacterium]|nr:HAD hydrolase-like protein [Alphaproteobacteria bacterium]